VDEVTDRRRQEELEPPAELSLSEFERKLFDRLSPFEQFQVLVLVESGIADSVRDALREVREYQSSAGSRAH
jgi:hypothetical protein